MSTGNKVKAADLLLRYCQHQLCDQGDQRFEDSFNEQNREPRYSSNTGETIQVMEPSAMNSSEQVQDDPMTALQRARELVAASVCGDSPLSYM